MPQPDAPRQQDLTAYAEEVRAALGDGCVGVVLYGSAAGVDWVPGRSDVNTVIVLRRTSVAALDALAPVVARWRPKGFALPVVLDDEQVEHARLLFPMELDDIKHQHRLLAGADPFAAIATDEAALRRECAQEAFGKLLRLRAFYLEHAADPPALTRMMTESLKSFLIVIRHLLRLRGGAAPHAYEPALAAGEAAVGPLPAMRQVLAHRVDASAPDEARLRALAGSYVEEVERVVAAVAAYCA
jgi:predicted nucleotidyltransferase